MYVVYREVQVSALSTPPTTVQVLPVAPPRSGRGAGARLHPAPVAPRRSSSELLPLYVRNAVYRALVETAAGEHGARRTAMKNATDNASDMLRRAAPHVQPRASGADHAGDRGDRRRRGGTAEVSVQRVDDHGRPRRTHTATSQRLQHTDRMPRTSARSSRSSARCSTSSSSRSTCPSSTTRSRSTGTSDDGDADPRRRPKCSSTSAATRCARSPCSSTDGVVRGMEVVDTGGADHGAGRRRRRSAASSTCSASRWTTARRSRPTRERWPIHRKRPDFVNLEPKTEVFETGIKVVDLIAPFVKGGKIGLFGGAGVGKTVVIQELINNVAEGPRRQVGVLRRGRAHARRQRPLPRDEGSRASSTPCALIYGQMNEPPGARLRVGLSGLTVAEYFRDVENARTCSCSSTTSSASRRRARKCRRCSAACRARWVTSRRWPPRWATCRSASPRRATARSRRCRRSTCRPTTSPIRRRPPRSRTSTRRSCSRARSRSSASTRPSIRSLVVAHPRPAVHRRAPLQGGDRGAAHPAALQGAAGHHRDPRHGRAVRRRQDDRRPRAPHAALPVAAVRRRRAVHRHRGQVRQARGHDRVVRAARAPASSTTCPSRRSSWRAASTTSSRRPRSSRRS